MKKYKHLTKEQRYIISVCLRKKMSMSAIAKLIDVSRSTISRETKRNSNMYRHYVAIDAQQFSDMRKHIARMLHTKVFFAHPYSSWEKGLIENTNKLIRQYIPNCTDFSTGS